MKATDEELLAIAEYYDALYIGQRLKDNFLNLATKQEKVENLYQIMQQVAKSFFLETLEYNNIVYKVAQKLDIDVKSEGATDINELEIGMRLIWNSFPNIPADQKIEMAELLGCEYTKSDTKLKDRVDGAIRANLHSAAKMYTFAAWLTKVIHQTFLNGGLVWQSTGKIVKFFRFFFGSGIGFRAGLIFPILHISMLRQKQRQGKAAKRA